MWIFDVLQILLLLFIAVELKIVMVNTNLIATFPIDYGNKINAPDSPDNLDG